MCPGLCWAGCGLTCRGLHISNYLNGCVLACAGLGVACLRGTNGVPRKGV